ncbi:MAG: hypothetical protein JJE46_14790 [Acidimicrobiia bacterium]|nr:hypothetical protein [Acidimicrobiia bacterium]
MVDRLLGDDRLARDIGELAYARVFAEFLGDRHLERYAHLLESLLE